MAIFLECLLNTTILQEDKLQSFSNWKNEYSEFSRNKKEDFLVKVYYSFENFKNYCSDMNVQKEPTFFQDLLSKRNDWFFQNGLNILIVERKVIASLKNYIYMFLRLRI